MASSPHSDDLNALINTLNLILQNQQAFQQDLTTLTAVVTQLRTRFGPPGFTPQPNNANPLP